ncbi:NepR family anti-sigma factor [Altererythrobacter sp. MTPC7]|uniref:NepR family anti-sigma factor n=1 Tax=Altererythrobacter sp. MTPC7 TaxID=3056567 RepID=UPI0036F1BD1F|nr:NepR family anti-sigma factor [Erythrobacteraceae bacterium WH01K]
MNDKKTTEPAATKTTARQAKDPQWANGLRQLYDSVVDEPLPDSFKDLLSKLDDSK